MRNYKLPYLALATSLFLHYHCASEMKTSQDYLILSSGEDAAFDYYKNRSGDTIIAPGKYMQLISDTFRTYAIVLHSELGYIVIARDEHPKYQIFNFDNGPDYPSDGLFRIFEKGKLGYADEKTLEVVIAPQFDCAYPFENGKARVSKNCQTVSDGEHSTWKSQDWFYIDKTGKLIPEEPMKSKTSDQ